MQDNDAEHVTGRRLDVNGGNMILFRGVDPVVKYGGPKRGADQDMLEYVRSQEQKLKLEKLKWQESTTRVQALHKPAATTVKPAAVPQVPKEKPVQRPKPSEVEARKPKVNPKHVAEVIENRNKRASQWLHKEQQEYQAKKAEILEHKRAAKELDQRRRRLEMEEAERKRQKQLQLLQDDPAFALALPVEASEVHNVPAAPVRAPIPSSEPVTLPHRAGSDNEGDLRLSHNTMVIHQVAAKLQLPTPPENELLAMRKRPGVPRLSKSYVNKAHLVSGQGGQGEQEPEGEHKDTSKPHTEPATKASEAPLLLARRAQGKPKPSSGAESDGSDEYGDDEDFEADEPGKDAATLAADTKLVEMLLGEERHIRAPHGDEDSDASEPEAVVDAITERTAAESQKRREDGRQYADRRRHQLYKQEAEARRQKALEEAKRQQALQLLKSHVVSINKRTKHTTPTATASVSDGQGQSQSTATASLRAMLNAIEAVPDEDDVEIDAQEDDHDRHPVGIRNAPPQSPARYALAEDKEITDMRDVDPVEVGGWNEFLRRESERAAALRGDVEDERRPVTAPSKSQARNSTSPPRLRPTTAVKGTRNAAQAGKTARTVTPPPFRFSSWQSKKAPERVAVTTPAVVVSRERTAPRKIAAASASAAKRKSSPTGGRHPRSTSAGSVGLSRRTGQASAPSARPPSRSQSQGRSRSVFQADALETDALDLFDRNYNHSSDDEVQYGEPDHDPIISHASSATSSGVGLGGYLSKSPARGFLSEDGHGTRNLYGPSPRVAAVLQEVTSGRSRAGTKSLEEQRLMQDVSSQAFRNFEQVTKVLQDVDRWCELAKEETLQLKEKLRMRESTESLGGFPHSSGGADIRQSPPRNERASVRAPERPTLNTMTLPDEQDIAVIRSSLAGKLSSQAQELFADSSSGGSSSSDTSKADAADLSYDRPQASAEVSRPARPEAVAEPESRSSIDEWRRQNAAVRARQSVTKIPAVAAEKPVEPSSSFRGVIERKQSQEETEDSVLMADPDDQSAEVSERSSDNGSEEPDDDEEDSYLRGVRERYEAHAQMAAAPQPPHYESGADFVQLAGRSADRPILWSAGPDRTAEAFSTKDPLLAQQLGMAADRNEILAKFSRLGVDSSLDAPPRRTAAVGSPSRYQHSEEEAAGVLDEEDWTKPFTRPVPAPVPAAKDAYLPSLRNVGELAGLLRSTYKAELETEAGRSAMLDASDSDADSSDDSSEMGGDYDSYSAVSIMAARMMAKQGEVLKAKEKQLEHKAAAETSVLPTATTTAAAETAEDTASTASTPVKDETFWAETLVKPERQLPDTEDAESSLALEEMLHDYAMDLRYGADGVPVSAPARAPTASVSAEDADAGLEGPKKIRYSGAEMRARMMEELRKQDELFNYTIELAELEKTHAMQQARDLAMQAQQRSAEELAHLQQRQELEMQRLAYENSLALSLVSAQGVMEKQSAEQREQLLQMQSRLSAQELFRQYQELLHQADQVAGNLEQNQKLQEMERLLQEDKAREIVAGLESKHAVEKAAMMVAHAEVQKSHAEALVAASRTSMELLAQQRASGEGLRGSRDSHLRQSREVQRPAPSAPSRYQADSDEENYEEEYSAQFETEASMSMRSRTTPMSAPVRKPLQRGANTSDSEEDSIPEDDDKSVSHDQSSAISDSIAYSPDVPRKAAGGRYGDNKPAQRALQASMQSSHLSVSTASGRGAAGTAAQRRDFDSDSEPDEVEDAIERSPAAEDSEASVFESYVESPAKAPYQSAQSYSQSSRAFEVSEASRPPPRAPLGQARAAQKFAASQSSANFEVEESNERSGSTAEEVPDESEEVPDGSEGVEEDYSDTFEASGSKSSKAASSISSGAPNARKPAQPAKTVTAATAAVLPTKTPRSSIPALESSSDSGAVFANSSIPAVLDEYRLEMEGRLRAQEKTYKLKVQFLKAKQTQRLEWLQKVKQNAKISGADIEDEEQRIHDAYAEERAEVERERWALNARAYKELRKFKRLRRDLLKYQVNVQNSAQAAAELEANLLTLRQSQESGEFEGFPLGRSSRGGKRGALQDSSESVHSSSDSAPAFRQARSSRTVPRAAAAAKPAVGSVAVPMKTSEVEDEYPEDDFEATFSTAAVSPQKAPSTQAVGMDASEASYSDTYESSVPARTDKKLAQSMQSVPESTKDISSASEVSSESISEAMDDSGMESEPEASYRPESESESSPARPTEKKPVDADFSEDFEETLDPSPQKPAAQSMESHDDSPVRAANTAVEGEASEEDYTSYDEDFVQESDQASEGRPGLQEAPRREESPAKDAVHVAPVTVQEDSQEVEDDIESEISAYGRESDASDEPYYLSSSAAKAEVLIAPIERKADVSAESAKEPLVEEEGEDSYSEDGFSHHSAEESQMESAQESPSKALDASTRSEALDRSTHSAGSAAAAREEDADEVQYGDDEDFAEYESDHEDENKAPAPAAVEPASPAVKSPAPAQKSIEESLDDSIATSISEEDEVAASARLDQSGDSGSEDYLATTNASLSLKPADHEAAENADLHVDVPSPSEASPQHVQSAGSASTHTKLSVQTATPTADAQPASSPDKSKSPAEPEVEFWGSEDFLESPAVLNRKTSELMLQHTTSGGHAGDELDAEDEDDPKKMRYDPEQQRWVGGEEVSLDGFDESVDAVGNDADTPAARPLPSAADADASQEVDDFAEVDTSLEEDLVRDDQEEEPQDTVQAGASQVLQPAPIGVADVAEAEDEYASDEFSFEEEASVQAQEGDSALPPSPAREAAPSDSEDAVEEDEVPEELQESVEDEDADEVAPVRQESRVSDNKRDLSVLSTVSEVPLVEESTAASASDLSGLLVELHEADEPATAAPAPSAEEAPVLSDQDTTEGNLTDMSLDYLETATAPQKSQPTAALVPAATASPEDSLLDAVLDLSYDDEAVELASEATEYAEMSDFRTDFVEAAWEVNIPVAVVKKPQVEIKAEEGKKEQDEQEQRMVLVEEVTDHLLDALVESECARVLQLVPAAFAYVAPAPAYTAQAAPSTAEPKARSPQRASESAREQPKAAEKEVDIKEDSMEFESTADLLAENMMKHSSKFSKPETTHSGEKESATSKGSLSSLGGLPSLGKSSLPPVSVHRAAAPIHDDDELDSKEIERPAEFGDDEDLYEFDIPSTQPTGVVHPPHGTEEPTKDEPQAGAALIAAVVAAEAANARCAEIISNTKTFLDEVFSRPDLQLAYQLADPDHEGRFLDAVPLTPEDLIVATGDAQAVHAAAMTDRINELCAEIFSAKHGSRTAGGDPSLPLSKRLLLQSLPLREDAVKAHIARCVLAEQQELVEGLKAGGDAPEAPVKVDIIDNFRLEAQREIELASNQMADALLARCLIETCVELGQLYDMSALFGNTRK